MSKQISLTLSDDIFRRAEVMAGRSGRHVADVLTEAIEVSLDPLALAGADALPLTAWSDERVLAAADSTMPEDDDRQLTELLDRQQADALRPQDHQTLRTLMQAYQEGLLNKSLGIGEAVRRGLRSAPIQ